MALSAGHDQPFCLIKNLSTSDVLEERTILKVYSKVRVFILWLSQKASWVKKIEINTILKMVYEVGLMTELTWKLKEWSFDLIMLALKFDWWRLWKMYTWNFKALCISEYIDKDIPQENFF